jgi:nucleotide-binding universal stress UspA family protein
MKDTQKSAQSLEKTAIPGFEVEQALVGLALDSTDDHLLKYLNFLGGRVPIRAAHFMHVVPRFDLFSTGSAEEFELMTQQEKINEKVADQMGENIHQLVKKTNIKKTTYSASSGDPLDALLSEAETIQTDLVVIGKKIATGSHAILAKNMVRKANSNSLVVPEGSRCRLESMLVPIDFSENSAQALLYALAINKQLAEPVSITCLNVYDTPNLSPFRMSKTEDEFQRMVEGDRMEAFDIFLSSYAPEGREYIKKVLIPKDFPATGHYIMDYVVENEFDLVIMGAKGHSKVELLLMGSVTDHLLSINNTVPTLVVK